MKRTAFIAGATGLVGKELLDLLIEDPYYERVIALVRKPLPHQINKLVQCTIEFDNISSSPELIRGTHIFCCLGSTIKKAGSKEAFYKVDYTYTVEIARQALKNGALQLNVISSLGADMKSFFFYSRVKGEMEETVRSLGYPSLNIFRPSLLSGDRCEFRLGEKLALAASRPLSRILGDRFKKYLPVEASTLARAMIGFSKKEMPGVNIIESDKIGELQT